MLLYLVHHVSTSPKGVAIQREGLVTARPESHTLDRYGPGSLASGFGMPMMTFWGLERFVQQARTFLELRTLRTSVREAEKSGDLEPLARSIDHLASRLERAGRTKEAVSHYLRAAGYYEKAGLFFSTIVTTLRATNLMADSTQVVEPLRALLRLEETRSLINAQAAELMSRADSLRESGGESEARRLYLSAYYYYEVTGNTAQKLLANSRRAALSKSLRAVSP